MLNTIIYIIIGFFVAYSLVIVVMGLWEGVENGRKEAEERQSLAYVYGRETKADADIANVLTMHKARRIAANIAKLPRLLGKS